MATQLAEAPGDAGGANDTGSIDFETEARKLGWKPVEEFSGDPGKHVDAETFYKRGQEMMPILRAQNRDLVKRLDKMERDQKKAAEFFSQAETRAHERAMADIRAEIAQAVESGDTKAANEALDRMGKLDKPTASKPDDIDPAQRAEEFADWTKRNAWYATNPALQSYADAQADILAKANGTGVLSKDDLDEVADRVRAKFEDTFPDAFGKVQQRQVRNPVDGGGTAPSRRGGRTFADLPPEAQAACDKWVKQGIIKSRDDYVKAYDFGDKK